MTNLEVLINIERQEHDHGIKWLRFYYAKLFFRSQVARLGKKCWLRKNKTDLIPWKFMNLVKKIFDYLKKDQQTLSVAESCTGGGLANEISALPGISEVFSGGIISYSNDVKINVLNIKKSVLLKHGAVSKETALMMAKNCCSLFSSTWALSTTGIAGPSGGSIEKPVGLVFIGLYGPKKTLVEKLYFQNVSRLQHRQKTILSSLELLLKHFDKK